MKLHLCYLLLTAVGKSYIFQQHSLQHCALLLQQLRQKKKGKKKKVQLLVPRFHIRDVIRKPTNSTSTLPGNVLRNRGFFISSSMRVSRTSAAPCLSVLSEVWQAANTDAPSSVITFFRLLPAESDRQLGGRLLCALVPGSMINKSMSSFI